MIPVIIIIVEIMTLRHNVTLSKGTKGYKKIYNCLSTLHTIKVEGGRVIVVLNGTFGATCLLLWIVSFVQFRSTYLCPEIN